MREPCINRNILECKVVNITERFDFAIVLIETYWNVKTKAADQVIDPAKVLIETYWNVK